MLTTSNKLSSLSPTLNALNQPISVPSVSSFDCFISAETVYPANDYQSNFDECDVPLGFSTTCIKPSLTSFAASFENAFSL